jgi:lysozyme family protein
MTSAARLTLRKVMIPGSANLAQTPVLQQSYLVCLPRLGTGGCVENEGFDVEALIDGLIEREGGYVNHPADKGGPTCFGITEAVARAHGYFGAMRDLPRDEAAAIYLRLFWKRPQLDAIAERSRRLAAELFDTGANMGPAVAATFLQRALTALNRNGRDYPDLVPDGRIGASTLAALDAYFAKRGKVGGEVVLMRSLEALQGERYLRLAEKRPANEAFLYGWLANRVGSLS